MALDATSTYRPYVNVTGEIAELPAGQVLASNTINGREVLFAVRTYYVATTGSDSNSGLAVGTPFLTIQKAIDVVAALDTSIYDITIQLAAGTYGTSVGNLLKQCIGGSNVIIIGDETTPSNVVIKTTSSGIYAIYGSGLSTAWHVRGVQFKTDATSCYAAYVDNGTSLRMQNVDFNAGTQNFFGHVRAEYGARIFFTGNYKISAGTTFHALALGSGVIRAIGLTIVTTGTPAWAAYGWYATNGGLLVYISNDYTTGSTGATGQRYYIDSNAVINTQGAATTVLPGNVAGGTATGGQYV